MNERAFGKLASRQHGVVTRDQVLGLGSSTNEIARRIAVGRWVALGNGVYHVAGSPTSWFFHLWTAVLRGGEGSAISHRAAAQLWGIRNYGTPWNFSHRDPDAFGHRTSSCTLR